MSEQEVYVTFDQEIAQELAILEARKQKLLDSLRLYELLDVLVKQAEILGQAKDFGTSMSVDEAEIRVQDAKKDILREFFREMSDMSSVGEEGQAS